MFGAVLIMRYSIPAFLALTTVLLLQPARAATVTTTADDGPGSLRDTIANAAAGETIDFSVTGLITLTSGQLIIDKNLTILGPGSDTLLIQRSLAESAGSSTLTRTRDLRINRGVLS